MQQPLTYSRWQCYNYEPINVRQWETKHYINIPQQHLSHSCGAYAQVHVGM